MHNVTSMFIFKFLIHSNLGSLLYDKTKGCYDMFLNHPPVKMCRIKITDIEHADQLNGFPDILQQDHLPSIESNQSMVNTYLEN